MKNLFFATLIALFALSTTNVNAQRNQNPHYSVILNAECFTAPIPSFWIKVTFTPSPGYSFQQYSITRDFYFHDPSTPAVVMTDYKPGAIVSFETNLTQLYPGIEWMLPLPFVNIPQEGQTIYFLSNYNFGL